MTASRITNKQDECLYSIVQFKNAVCIRKRRRFWKKQDEGLRLERFSIETVWKIIRNCFGLALLRMRFVIGLKNSRYFGLTWKIKTNRDLVTTGAQYLMGSRH